MNKSFLSLLLMFTTIGYFLLLTSCKKEPHASFTVSSTNIDVGDSVSFTNTSKSARKYEWDFGDNTPIVTENSPTHVYNTAGILTVTLTATKRDKKSIATEQITVKGSNIYPLTEILTFTSNSIHLDVTVANNGAISSNVSSDIGYYASTDTTITSSDNLLGTDYFGTLTVGATSEEHFIIDLCTVTALSSGTYYIGYIIDYLNTIPETDENDNVRVFTSSTITIDCTPTNLTTTTDNLSVSGTTVTIDVTIINNGGMTSNFCDLGYYASTDITINTSDYLLGTDDVTSLVGGGTSNEYFNQDLNNVISLPSGTYYIGYIIDHLNNVSESNENDNTVVFSTTVTK